MSNVNIGFSESRLLSDVSLALYLARQMYLFREFYVHSDPNKEGDLMDVVLKQFPFTATRERTIMKGMVRYVSASADSTEFEHVLNCIPFNMRNIYISAYQSWIWNRVCNFRIELGIANRSNSTDGLLPIVGDILLADISHEESDTFDSKDIKIRYFSDVDVANLGKQIGQDNQLQGQVVIPLPGKNIVYPRNEVGEFMKQLLREDGFTDEDITKLKCSGSYRKILQDAYGSIHHAGRCVTEDGSFNCTVQLKLPSGSYATTFLRELLNNNNVM